VGGVAFEDIDVTGVWNTGVGGFQQGSSTAYLVKYVLTISGSSYTVTDNDTGTVVFQG
jgi:glutamate mutase epsilon subunit